MVKFLIKSSSGLLMEKPVVCSRLKGLKWDRKDSIRYLIIDNRRCCTQAEYIWGKINPSRLRAQNCILIFPDLTILTAYILQGKPQENFLASSQVSSQIWATFFSFFIHQLFAISYHFHALQHYTDL